METIEKEAKGRINKKVAVTVSLLLMAAIIFYCYVLELNSPEGKDVPGENRTSQVEVEENKEEIENIDKMEEVATTEGALEEGEGEATTELAPQNPVLEIPMLPEGDLLASFNNTLMIGDSRTEGFKLYSGVKNAAYFCLKGITIEKINAGQKANVNGASLDIYQVLDNNTFDKVIVCIGMNELGWSSMDSFLTEYGKLVDEIKARQPNAQIILHAVLPVSQDKDAKDAIYNNNHVAWFNENIVRLATSKGARFVNPSAVLVNEEGFLLNEGTHDGVHLSSQYCKLWANYLANLI